jgi:hypothetical protein
MAMMQKPDYKKISMLMYIGAEFWDPRPNSVRKFFSCTWEDETLRQKAYTEADRLLGFVRDNGYSNGWEQTLIDARIICEDMEPITDQVNPVFERPLRYGGDFLNVDYQTISLGFYSE